MLQGQHAMIWKLRNLSFKSWKQQFPICICKNCSHCSQSATDSLVLITLHTIYTMGFQDTLTQKNYYTYLLFFKYEVTDLNTFSMLKRINKDSVSSYLLKAHSVAMRWKVRGSPATVHPLNESTWFHANASNIYTHCSLTKSIFHSLSLLSGLRGSTQQIKHEPLSGGNRVISAQ